MPLHISRAQAHLSGSVLHIRLSTPQGVSAIYIEESARLRIFEDSPSGGLLLGFVERTSPEVLHVFSARILAGASPQHLAASLQQFLNARQLSTTGSAQEILGYFSPRPSDDGSLAPEDAAFVKHAADRGIRFVITRHADDSSHSLWIRGVTDERAMLVSWDPRPGPAEPTSAAPVPESLAALSDATLYFGTKPVVVTPAKNSAARWVAPGAIALITLLAAGGYIYYRKTAETPVAPEITVSVAGSPSNAPVDPPATEAPTLNLGWNRDPQPPPAQKPVPATPTPTAAPPPSPVPPPTTPKPQPRQLNLDILKGSGPQAATPQIDLPSPSSAAAPVPANQLPTGVGSAKFQAPPPPPPKETPAPIQAQNRFVPAKLARRGGITVPANLLRGLPPNSSVSVLVTLDARGKVLSVAPSGSSSGVSAFVANLVASNVRTWEFQPATQGGTAVQSSTTVQVNIRHSEQ